MIHFKILILILEKIHPLYPKKNIVGIIRKNNSKNTEVKYFKINLLTFLKASTKSWSKSSEILDILKKDYSIKYKDKDKENRLNLDIENQSCTIFDNDKFSESKPGN